MKKILIIILISAFSLPVLAAPGGRSYSGGSSGGSRSYGGGGSYSGGSYSHGPSSGYMSAPGAGVSHTYTTSAMQPSGAVYRNYNYNRPVSGNIYRANYTGNYAPSTMRPAMRPVVVNNNYYPVRNYSPYRPFIWGLSMGLGYGLGYGSFYGGWYPYYPYYWGNYIYYTPPRYQTSYNIVNYIYNQNPAEETQQSPQAPDPNNSEENQCTIYCHINSRGECICPANY